jgi:hypothetical protein
MKKFTAGTWYVSDIPQQEGFYVYSRDNTHSAIARVYTENTNSKEAAGNAEIIVSAVNNTVGQNINPLAVPDLVNAVRLILQLNANTKNEFGIHLTDTKPFQLAAKALAKSELTIK